MTISANDNFLPADLLMGAAAISEFLGVTPRQVYRLTYDGIIPHFKLGGTVSARKSSLVAWMAQAERASSRAA
ncbi:helix-turn-helix domain-containing protein [Neorhizobium sp. T7_12]|uniref:helix-turn-helix domain-containing protein n=1 Tax=Neorhizobium sp. T7_12 TaxID=2093832 RepID=UPI000CF9BBE4|nr:helix-turn-helix domain-containing protein [Neorhizobium sp. T7_12]